MAGLWWAAFHGDPRVPILTYVNLGLHEAGHMFTYAFADLVTAMMGSIAQVAAPLAIAGYFLFLRDDWVAAGVCLAWAATSAVEVAVYVADAPDENLVLIGGMHDWAFILGPEGYDALERAGEIAGAIRDGAAFAVVAALGLCLGASARALSHGASSISTVRPPRRAA